MDKQDKIKEKSFEDLKTKYDLDYIRAAVDQLVKLHNLTIRRKSEYGNKSK